MFAYSDATCRLRMFQYINVSYLAQKVYVQEFRLLVSPANHVALRSLILFHIPRAQGVHSTPSSGVNVMLSSIK
jgi:hypothetical protein